VKGDKVRGQNGHGNNCRGSGFVQLFLYSLTPRVYPIVLTQEMCYFVEVIST